MNSIRPDDRLEYIDHRSSYHPQRVCIHGAAVDEIVEARVLEVARDRVEAQLLVGVDVARTHRPGDLEDASGCR